MGKKNHRKSIRSLNQRIDEHQEKIRSELEKDYPDQGLVNHWKKEIQSLFKSAFRKHKNEWGTRLMQTTERPIAIQNPTLQTMTRELGHECQKVITLLNQLQIPDLNPIQQTNILAELLTSSIYLQTHCGETFQDHLSDALESLPDTDEA